MHCSENLGHLFQSIFFFKSKSSISQKWTLTNALIFTVELAHWTTASQLRYNRSSGLFEVRVDSKFLLIYHGIVTLGGMLDWMLPLHSSLGKIQLEEEGGRERFSSFFLHMTQPQNTIAMVLFICRLTSFPDVMNAFLAVADRDKIFF